MSANDIIRVEFTREALEGLIQRLNEAKIRSGHYVQTFKYDEYRPGQATILSEGHLEEVTP